MRKELIQKAYQMGYESFPRFRSLPRQNPNFKTILPKDSDLTFRMHKEYIKGWVRAFLECLKKDN